MQSVIFKNKTTNKKFLVTSQPKTPNKLTYNITKKMISATSQILCGENDALATSIND